MKKFKCTVTRTDEYVIELDENVLNEEWMENFRSYMFPLENLEEHAKHLAQMQARFSDYNFIEGYGNVTRNGKPLYKTNPMDSPVAKGININIINEDNDCEVETEEII